MNCTKHVCANCFLGVFTVCCLVSPAVVNLVGNRAALLLGASGYGGLVIFSWLFLEGHVGSSWVLFGGAWCGASAACLWTGQGRYVNFSSGLVVISMGQLQIQHRFLSRVMLMLTSQETRGLYFGVFWAFFQSAGTLLVLGKE